MRFNNLKELFNYAEVDSVDFDNIVVGPDADFYIKNYQYLINQQILEIEVSFNTISFVFSINVETNKFDCQSTHPNYQTGDVQDSGFYLYFNFKKENRNLSSTDIEFSFDRSAIFNIGLEREHFYTKEYSVSILYDKKITKINYHHNLVLKLPEVINFDRSTDLEEQIKTLLTFS